MDKFKDLSEKDDIQTIASTLKTALEEYKREYESMKADGKIDDNELNRIITTMQELEFKARTLKTNMSNPEEMQTMDEIINIINAEQVNMINAKKAPAIEGLEVPTEENEMVI